MKSNKTLYLIDGANYVFRAFYAIRNLSNSRGLPTGALYGFAQMLLKLLRDETPDLVAVCFDTAAPTFRDEMYGEYKANRKEPPEDLVEQFPYVRPLTEALGFPVIEKDGFEADDLIGTLAKKFAKQGVGVVIVSGDKDLMQLIEPGISILDEMKGIRVGPDEVRKKFGVGPDKVVEVLGLAGDASDNIPGIMGVGPKTAATLINQYGTIENLIAHASEIKGAVGEKVRKGAESALLSRALAKIDIAVDIDLSGEDLTRKEIDSEKASRLFSDLGFQKLLDQLLPKKSAGEVELQKMDGAKASEYAGKKIRKAGRVAFTFELASENLVEPDVLGVFLSWSENVSAYLPIKEASKDQGQTQGQNFDLFSDLKLQDSKSNEWALKFFKDVIADSSITKLVHNFNRELMIIRALGFEVGGQTLDVMLASYVRSPTEKHGMEELSLKYLDQKARAAAPERVEAIFRLAEILGREAKKAGLESLLMEMEMPLVPVLVNMQRTGVLVDAEWLRRMSEEFSKRLSVLEAEIYKLAGQEFNVNSPKQLGEILFGKLMLPGAKKTKTGYSTSQDILEELSINHELPKFILDYRSLSKLKGTYIDALPRLVNEKTGRIHTSFNQAVTATGRLSSSDPNLQNIPIRGDEGERIRRAFIAKKGFVLLSADYSQIELRVLAHMSGEMNLISAFEKDEDVHALTASQIFGVVPENVTKEQRAVGKTVNFATIYGQTAYGLSRQLKIEVGDAADYIDGYFKKYPAVAKYREEVLEKALRDGFVETLFGRRRFFPDIASTNQQMAELSRRMAFNTVFQGTAADIIKRAMILIHRDLPEISKDARMLIQVHDELVFEVPGGDALKVKGFVVELMQNAASLKVPLIVDAATGPNWSLAH